MAAGNYAYGQTDVTHDPNYWRAQLTSSNPKLREEAALMLRELSADAELSQRQAFQAQNLAESRAQRADISAANRASREEIAKERISGAQDSREARALAAHEAEATRRASALQLGMSDPALTPAERAMMKTEYLKTLGLTSPQPAVAGGTKGEYGPGGAPSATTYTPPTAAFAQTAEAPDYSSYNRDYNYPVLPNTPEQRFVAQGAGPLEGSRFLGVDNQNHAGYRTPSGGFIGTSAPRNAEGNMEVDPNVLALRENTFGTGATQPVATYKPPTESFTSAPTKPAAGTSPGRDLLNTTLKIGAAGAAFPYTSAVLPLMFGRSGGAQTTAQAPQPAPLPGGPQPNPTPGGTPAPSALESFYNAPIITPTPGTTPPAVIHPQASNERTDLLRDTDNIFFGGGNAPPPTPTPTPARVATAPLPTLNPLQLQQILQRRGSDYAFA